MKVVVTGGAGFIGSHLCAALATQADLHVVDDLSVGRAAHLPPVATLHRGSILDEKLLAEAMAGATHVYHLAAMVSVPQSIADPIRAHEINATGTLRVLEAARRADVMKVVFAASSAAYGDGPEQPKSESMRPQPMSPYAVGKLAGEDYCRVYARTYGMGTTALRFFNVYGPRQDPNGAYAAAIPKFIAAALRNDPITIYGDGAQTRDFVHVRDVVRALRAASTPRASGQVLNVGAGRTIDLNSLARKVVELCGSSSPIIHAEARAGDIKHSAASVSEAAAQLGFRAEVGLDEGLKDTVAWFVAPK